MRFDTADGIAAGKTEVRCRSVRVGVVKKVTLAEDLKSVLTYLELDADAEHLLRTGTRFWVVRPRISVSRPSRSFASPPENTTMRLPAKHACTTCATRSAIVLIGILLVS